MTTQEADDVLSPEQLVELASRANTSEARSNTPKSARKTRSTDGALREKRKKKRNYDIAAADRLYSKNSTQICVNKFVVKNHDRPALSETCGGEDKHLTKEANYEIADGDTAFAMGQALTKPAQPVDHDKETGHSRTLDADMEAALPPDLARRSARDSQQPGSFRVAGGASAAALTAMRRRDTDDDSVTVQESIPEDGLNVAVRATSGEAILEATLVNDQDKAPIYNAEIMQERRRVWFGSRCLCGITVAAVIAVIGVGVALARDLWDDDDGNEWPRLEDYDRITHHVALFGFESGPACELKDAGNELEVSKVTVTLKCGDVRTFAANNDAKEPLIVLGEDTAARYGCIDVDQDEIHCRVGDNRGYILFSCGTTAAGYNTTGIRTTAEFGIGKASLACNSSSDSVEPFAAFATVGRLCRPELDQDGTASLFKTVGGCTSKAGPELFAGNETGYCYRKEKDCVDGGCVEDKGNLDRFAAKDTLGIGGCQAINQVINLNDLDGDPFNELAGHLVSGLDDFIETWVLEQTLL